MNRIFLFFIMTCQVYLVALSQDTARIHYNDPRILKQNWVEDRYNNGKIDTSIFVYEVFIPDSVYLVFYDYSFSKLAYKCYNKNDSVFHYQYYRSGKIKHTCIDKAGDLLYVSDYCENGSLIFEWNKGDYHYKWFYCNGKIKKDYFLDREVGVSFDGKYKEWYSNGNLKVVGTYENNEKVGKWLYYNEPGGLKKEEDH